MGLFHQAASFDRGVHPPGRKHFSADMPIEALPYPKQVVLPLQQHIGSPCLAVVKPRQEVAQGEILAKGQGFISACLHSPVAGKVKKSVSVTLPNGRHVPAIVIETAASQAPLETLRENFFGSDWPTTGMHAHDPEEISNAIAAAGIVGLGGAAFPTHVKIMPNIKRPVHTFVVNGCECEPYLTADYRIMVEAPQALITGALLAARSLDAANIIVGVENNKMEAVESLKRAARGTPVKIAILKTKYPQGSEKQLIMALLKRKVPLGGLPSDVGVAINNVGTVSAVARAVLRGIPLTHRVISVTGGGILKPKNLLVPMGAAFSELIDFCGGLKPDAARLVAGGPMMGFSFANTDTPVTKGTSGLTVLTHAEIRKDAESNCVRCGRCVDACPMNLVPTKLALASRHQDMDLTRHYNILACFECGACAYICPAKIPLVQLIRIGKAAIAAMNKE